ncbi:DUF4439 domain-containing protein [Spongisporangium articulatum]|uniref:DUF4439 domain-containing protein n=1 Tax=Spongisporangium articulatum TaxID=3362603 RepID=A0ABW8ANK4_9ACTN
MEEVGLERRVVLAGLAVFAIAGCTNPFDSDGAGPAAQASRGAEQQAVEAAVARARALRTGAAALAQDVTQSDRVRALMLDVTRDHEDQLAALGAPFASTSGTAGASPSVSPSTSPSPAAGDPAAAQLDAEWSSAVQAFQAGRSIASGPLALLLVRLAASDAAHADLTATATKARVPAELTVESASPAAASVSPSAGPSPSPSPSATPSVTPTPSPGSVFASPTERALNRQLAGEHAAVYAYPLVIARTTGARRKLAQQLWAEHRARREVLVARLLSAGVAPVQSEPAYVVQPVPTTAGQAAELAARIEAALATLAADVVATAPVGADRDDGAEQLVLAARRAAGWSGRTEGLPGRRSADAQSSPSAPATTGAPALSAPAST